MKNLKSYITKDLYILLQENNLLDSLVQRIYLQNELLTVNITEKESGSGIECWVCSGDIIVGEALACGSCGARYHRPGQVGGCDILSLGKCLHCNADWNELVDA